jgi:hypothetical protein
MMNKKVWDENLKVHKKITRIIADGIYTYEKNKGACDMQQILGEELALVYSKFQCENPECGEQNNLTIHHMVERINKRFVPFNKYWSQRRYFFNIVILCHKCHDELNGHIKTQTNAISDERIAEVKKKYGIV